MNIELEKQLIWIAGFIEGDGCLSLSKKEMLFLEISQCRNRACLDKIKEILGGNVYEDKGKKSLITKAEHIYKWIICGRNAEQVTLFIMPYFWFRRQEFEEKLLDYNKTKKETKRGRPVKLKLPEYIKKT